MALKVFVTGATGLIGRAAVQALSAAGHTVVGLTSRAENLPTIREAGGTGVVGDMRDPSRYREAALDADAIIHAAAAFPDKVRYSQADVDAFMGADADAVDALLTVVGPSCRAFVFSSGAYTYGDTGPAAIDEAHPTTGHHPIMRRKLETEAKLLGLARAGRVPAIVMRPGLIYGKGSIWSKLYLEPMLRGRRAMIPGNGRNIVSFVHADDVGQAYRAVVERPVPGEIYNVGDDEPAALGDVVRAQALALGAPAPFSVPGALIRLVAGPFSGAPLLAHGAVSNRKLKALGFACRYPRYPEGVAALGQALRA